MFSSNIDAKNLILESDADVELDTFGNEPLSIGTSNSTNLGIDSNEIQARDNGKASTLTLNNNGGAVWVGGTWASVAKLVIQGNTVNSNSYTDTNPKLEFMNRDASQNISLTFNDYDAVQAPASLTLNGNQGNEYFIAPNIKVNNNLTLDSTNGISSGYGKAPLTIGFPSGTGDGLSLGFDRNSMQVKRNGETSTMYLNYYGGMVVVNEQSLSDGGLKVKQKMVIPTSAPANKENGCIWIG